MALLSLKAHSVGFNISMIFIALSCFALGYLVATSGLFPKVLGVLIAMLFPSILFPALVGELSFALWLTVKGLNPAGSQEKAGGPIASS